MKEEERQSTMIIIWRGPFLSAKYYINGYGMARLM